MKTLAQHRAFNARTQKARISAGWSHDSSHFSFARQHNSTLPFAEPRRTNSALEALVGVVAFAGFIGVMLLLGGM